MPLRLAGEDYAVVQGLDSQGWLREIKVSDGDPALRIRQDGTGKVYEFMDGSLVRAEMLDGGDAYHRGRHALQRTSDGTEMVVFDGDRNLAVDWAFQARVGEGVNKTTYNRVSSAPTEGSTITATNAFHALAPTAAITLSATNAIANGLTGQLLILQGTSDTNTVTINDNANTQLGAASRVLGANDILVLVYDGADWVEIAYANN